MKHTFNTVLIGLAITAAYATTDSASAQSTLRPTYDAKAVAQASAAKEPAGLRAAAEAGLRSLINDLSKDIKSDSLPDAFPFDVNDLSELKTAKLGLGFEVFSAHPQTLLAGGRPFDQMLLGTGVWNFVVLTDGHPAALLELEKVNGKWQVNGAGAAKLAQDVHATSENHAGKNAFRFVRIYQATADFMEVKDMEGKARYAPLIAARQSLRMSAASAAALPGASADVLPELQEAVRGHLARFGK
jgi:hypothetical protein